MGEAKLVMIAMRDEIAAQGVEQLLNRSRKVSVIRTHFYDELSLFQETLSVQPAVLITDDAAAPLSRPDITQLFGICPDLRVVLVDLNANRAQLFGRMEACYQNAGEFLNIIEGLVGN